MASGDSMAGNFKNGRRRNGGVRAGERLFAADVAKRRAASSMLLAHVRAFSNASARAARSMHCVGDLRVIGDAIVASLMTKARKSACLGAWKPMATIVLRAWAIAKYM